MSTEPAAAQFNLGMARGVASDTKKRTFDAVKIKYDPNDLSVAWVFDELERRYVEIPCTSRRYADGLPLWLHNRLKEYASEKRLRFESEIDMLAVRDAYAEAMSRIAPEATATERRAAARYADSAQGRAFLGDAAKLIEIKPSPSGMESIVPHGDRIGTRGDATRIAPRSANGNSRGKSRRDRRNASRDTPSTPAKTAGKDPVRPDRRLDIDLAADGYS